METTSRVDADHIFSQHEAAILENLIVGCGKVAAGTKLLLINESGSVAVDKTTVEKIYQFAMVLGATVESIWAPPAPGPEDIPAPLIEKINSADVTIFNHSMGAMLRLRPGIGSKITILNYISNEQLLSSGWGIVPYALWDRVNAEIGTKLDSASVWEITCPSGTKLHGRFPAHNPNRATTSSSGFTLLTFPVGTHRPMGAVQATGKLAVRWMASSANHDVGVGLFLECSVIANVEASRIVGFDGPQEAISKVENYLKHIGHKNKKDPFLINSWHAGTNPLTNVPWPLTQDINSWQLVSHNSPRLLHFHVVGEQVPGELSIPILDAKVEIDGETWWNRGRISLLEALPISSWVGEGYEYVTRHVVEDSSLGISQ